MSFINNKGKYLFLVLGIFCFSAFHNVYSKGPKKDSNFGKFFKAVGDGIGTAVKGAGDGISKAIEGVNDVANKIAEENERKRKLAEAEKNTYETELAELEFYMRDPVANPKELPRYKALQTEAEVLEMMKDNNRYGHYYQRYDSSNPYPNYSYYNYNKGKHDLWEEQKPFIAEQAPLFKDSADVQKAIQQREERKRQLETAARAPKMPEEDFNRLARVKTLKSKIKEVEDKRANDQRRSEEMKDSLTKAATGLVNKAEKALDLGLEELKERAGHARKKDLEASNIAAQGEQTRRTLTQFLTPKYIALGVGGVTAAVAGYYAVKLTARYIEAKMGKPSLVRESSRTGLQAIVKDFFTDMFFGTEEEGERKISDMVLAPDVEQRIVMLAEDTKQTRAYGLPYQNVLFYGPPGTGKTEFAKTLAYYSEMDYAILSGADFDQFKDGEGIVELHKLFDWAERSDRGLLIFIDEADACFRDRAMLSKDGINIVNAFLSHTGTQSTKFMIVLATNYEDELDAAVRSRIHKKIPFDLPSAPERLRIIEKKLEKYVLNDKRVYEIEEQEVEASLTVAPDVNEAFLNVLAQKTEGFSGRDLDQAVAEVRLRAYRSGNDTVTKEIMETVFQDKLFAIEKDRQATEYQRNKFKQNNAQALAAAAAVPISQPIVVPAEV
jgi:ATPase family AAA domain-containing protein 3A/B